MGMKQYFSLSALTLAMAAFSSSAFAASCTDTAGFGQSLAPGQGVTKTLTLTAGDVVTLKIENTGASVVSAFIVTFPSGVTNPIFFDGFVTGAPGAGTIGLAPERLSETGTYSFDIKAGAGGFKFDYSCVPGETANQSIRDQVQAGLQTNSQVVASQVKGLLGDRIKSFSSTIKSGGATGALPLSAGRGDGSAKGGAAGGDDSPRLGVWANVAWTGFKDSSAVVKSDGNAWAFVAGADYAFTSESMAGVAFVFDQANTDTDYNRGKMESRGFGLAPYAAFRITDLLSASVLASYSFVDTETERFFSATQNATGETEAHRMMVAGDLSVDTMIDNFTFNGSLGISWLRAWQNSYTERTSNLVIGATSTETAAVTLAAQPGYMILVDEESNSWLHPYLRGQYSYNYVQTEVNGHPNDADAFRVGGGIDAFTDGGYSLNASVDTELGRKNYRDISASVTARIAF